MGVGGDIRRAPRQVAAKLIKQSGCKSLTFLQAPRGPWRHLWRACRGLRESGVVRKCLQLPEAGSCPEQWQQRHLPHRGQVLVTVGGTQAASLYVRAPVS